MDILFISKNEIGTAISYEEFIKKQVNNIGINLGTDRTKNSMTEMIMWIGSEDEIVRRLNNNAEGLLH